MSIGEKQSAFACRLDALTTQERAEQRERRAQLERGITRVTEDTDGYTFLTTHQK